MKIRLIRFIRRQRKQDALRRHLHFREGKEFLPQILQRGTDMINRIVDNQEPVVDVGPFFHFDLRILAVVAAQVQLELVGDVSGYNLGRNIVFAFRERHQDGFVNIVVYQDDTAFRRLYQVGGKDMGVKDLAVIENAFNGRQ